jgi:putative copper resistance protein D
MRTIAIAAHATHVLAAGTWIGGLIPLALILARTRRAGRPAVAVFDRALHRFSIIGMAAIALLLAGGLVDASSRLGSPTAFVASAWGRVVVCKIVLFLAMITGASVNRFVLMPRLSARPEATMAGLARNIAFEQATGCLVLAAAALLGILTPPE